MKIVSVLARLFAGVMACAAVSARADLLGGTWYDSCACYRGMVWGSQAWYEPEVMKALQQDLDYFPVSRTQQNSPLIIYAHAAKSTKYIPAGGVLFTTLVEQARANGFSVASIEYRHPVKDDFIEPAPHDDIADATRWLRLHAAELAIDTRNVFFLGHSRGTLVVWTALHYQGDPTVAVNAVYGYNAQTTYVGDEMAQRFLIPDDRQTFVGTYDRQHPQYSLFGSALDDATATMPPMLLRYEKPFYRTLVPASEFTEHHPDFGLALCVRLQARSPRFPCIAVDNTPIEHAYDGFMEFFLQYLQP
jgi:acetyl esterase/lipase